jgi:hypothetical protein
MYAPTENMDKSGIMITELYQRKGLIIKKQHTKEFGFLLDSQVNRKLADYHNPQVHDFFLGALAMIEAEE